MSNNQLFFAMATLMLTLFALAVAFFKYYIDAKIDPLKGYIDAKTEYLDVKITHIDAKIDPIARNVDRLVDYMVDHAERIARLEERTKS